MRSQKSHKLIEGNRKLFGFKVSILVYIIMFGISLLVSPAQSLSDIGELAQGLGFGISSISGVFFIANSAEHFAKRYGRSSNENVSRLYEGYED